MFQLCTISEHTKPYKGCYLFYLFIQQYVGGTVLVAGDSTNCLLSDETTRPIDARGGCGRGGLERESAANDTSTTSGILPPTRGRVRGEREYDGSALGRPKMCRCRRIIIIFS